MTDKEKLVTRARELSDEARAGDGSASDVREEQRIRMADALSDIAKALENGETLGKYGGTLSRQIIDSWPLGNELGNRISEFEEQLDGHLARI